MWRRKISSRLAQYVLRFWPLVLIGTLALSAASLPRTIQLFKTISTDPIDLLPKNNPNVQELLQVREKLERGSRAALVFESDDPDQTIKFLRDTVQQLQALPFVGRVVDRKIGYDFFNHHKLLFMDLEDLRTIRDRIDRRIQQEKLKGLYMDFGDEDEEFSFKDAQGDQGEIKCAQSS